MCIKYWKSMEIPNSTICFFKLILDRWWQFCRCFLHCVPWIKFWKNEDKWWCWKSMENVVLKTCGNPDLSKKFCATFAAIELDYHAKAEDFALWEELSGVLHQRGRTAAGGANCWASWTPSWRMWLAVPPQCRLVREVAIRRQYGGLGFSIVGGRLNGQSEKSPVFVKWVAILVNVTSARATCAYYFAFAIETFAVSKKSWAWLSDCVLL